MYSVLEVILNYASQRESQILVNITKEFSRGIAFCINNFFPLNNFCTSHLVFHIKNVDDIEFDQTLQIFAASALWLDFACVCWTTDLLSQGFKQVCICCRRCSIYIQKKTIWS